MSVTLQYPPVTPTTTLTLRDASFQPDQGALQLLGPAGQQVAVALGGNVFVYDLTSNQEVLLPIAIDLPEADDGSFSGWNSLRNFFETVVFFRLNVFRYTDADGVSQDVRLWSDLSTIREVRRQSRWVGTLVLRKEIP